MAKKRGLVMIHIEGDAIINTHHSAAWQDAESHRKQVVKDSEVRGQRIPPNYQVSKWPMDLQVPHSGCLRTENGSRHTKESLFPTLVDNIEYDRWTNRSVPIYGSSASMDEPAGPQRWQNRANLMTIDGLDKEISELNEALSTLMLTDR